MGRDFWFSTGYTKQEAKNNFQNRECDRSLRNMSQKTYINDCYSQSDILDIDLSYLQFDENRFIKTVIECIRDENINDPFINSIKSERTISDMYEKVKKYNHMNATIQDEVNFIISIIISQYMEYIEYMNNIISNEKMFWSSVLEHLGHYKYIYILYS